MKCTAPHVLPDCRVAAVVDGLEVDAWCDACKAALEGVRHCRVCGCTDDDACEGGCSWVATDLSGDLCSRCGCTVAWCWMHSRRQAIGAAALHRCDPDAAPRLFR